ncbi:MAG: GerMN domain-containing protein [Syntrophales bacterium]|jgi:spore germination protein GerM|nr:GerMN domain-containing protein [Syntrophales bacterium]MDY0043472.1 GerMN domain-containing protein [Syntrophales bacterium]
MATKKQKKSKQIKAKKQKKTRRIIGLTIISAICLGFLIFFFVSLFDYIYPPATGTTSATDKNKTKVALFFSDDNERFLVPEIRYIQKRDETKDQAEEMIKALIDGPKKGHVRTLPEGTTLIGVTLAKNQVAIVNFNKNIRELHPGSCASEIMTVYSLTNTLTHNIPSIKSISLQIEGKNIKTLKGHINTESRFVMKRDLIVKDSV